MNIFHISDLHYSASDNHSGNRLEALFESIREQNIKPDLILVTGDILNRGYSDYQHIFSLLQNMNIPFLCITGNHDESSNLINALKKYVPNHPLSENKNQLYYVCDDFPIRIIALDSFKENTPGGCVDENQLIWLEQQLCNNPFKKPVIVMVHQFSVNAGLNFFDIKTRQPWCDKFNAIISNHSDTVKLVACGHVHNGISSNISGVPIVASFSANWQAKYDFTPIEDVMNLKRQAGYYIHRYDGNRIISYAMTNGDFPRV